MFRWCAYCWRFLGEREPLRDFSPTHGICERCREKDALSDPNALRRLRPIAEFHAAMVRVALDGERIDPAAIVARGAELSLAPMDLLIGILQPALYQVGKLWEEGRARAADEARLTQLCEEVLAALSVQQQARLPTKSDHPVLALAAGGNAHTFGLQIVAFALREAGCDVRVFAKPPSAAHLVELCEILRPRALCISVALEAQLTYVESVASLLHERNLAIPIFIGGQGIHPDIPVGPNVRVCRQSEELIAMLRAS